MDQSANISYERIEEICQHSINLRRFVYFAIISEISFDIKKGFNCFFNFTVTIEDVTTTRKQNSLSGNTSKTKERLVSRTRTNRADLNPISLARFRRVEKIRHATLEKSEQCLTIIN